MFSAEVNNDRNRMAAWAAGPGSCVALLRVGVFIIRFSHLKCTRSSAICKENLPYRENFRKSLAR